MYDANVIGAAVQELLPRCCSVAVAIECCFSIAPLRSWWRSLNHALFHYLSLAALFDLFRDLSNARLGSRTSQRPVQIVSRQQVIQACVQ
jgi:hypothetical protein